MSKTLLAGAVLASLSTALAPAALAQTRTGQPPPTVAASDPWEGANRKLYEVGRVIDYVAVRPAAVFYHHATPTPVRRGVTNVLSNMSQPVVVINDVLQLRPANAARSLTRLVVNSTAGVGGVFDVASRAGIPYHRADFGQTLGRYGVPSGAYIFVPVLGPTTVRDGFGRVVDAVLDPLNTIRYDGRDALVPSRAVLNGLDARDRADPLLKDIERTATDPYVTTRSLYLQNRRAAISGKNAPTPKDVEALPDFGPSS